MVILAVEIKRLFLRYYKREWEVRLFVRTIQKRDYKELAYKCRVILYIK